MGIPSTSLRAGSAHDPPRPVRSGAVRRSYGQAIPRGKLWP